MKTLLTVLALAAVAHAGLNVNPKDPQDKCGGVTCAKNFNYDENCATAIRAQISRELEASMTYLAAGAHFAQDDVNRPGVSQIFFDHAKEERDHAIKLADYLSLRGDTDTNYLQAAYRPLKDDWESVMEGLSDALAIEKAVTRHFTEMVSSCESDWHAADWLVSEMLDEQHKGSREFSGLITKLHRMTVSQPHLGEYLFDREL